MCLEVIKKAIVSDDLKTITASAARSAFNKVVDEDEDFDDLQATRKSHIGFYFEHYWLKYMGLPANTGRATAHLGLIHDTRIAGADVDIKFTVGKDWMVARKCVGAYLILGQTNFINQTVSLGLFHAVEEDLRPGKNGDSKRSISAEGKKKIDWLIVDSPLNP